MIAPCSEHFLAKLSNMTHSRQTLTFENSARQQHLKETHDNSVPSRATTVHQLEELQKLFYERPHSPNIHR